MKTVINPYFMLMVCGALVLSACATAPQPPTDALQAADIAVANAHKDRAAEYAPLEMRTAHEKLAAAHNNGDKPDEQRVTQSRWLADEARADAELASAKTRFAQADLVNQDLRKSSETLRQELQRSSGN